jgi:ubiquinone/menaquinone biosynthesis C-methylase UbiE
MREASEAEMSGLDPAWIARILGPERRARQDPEAILKAIGVRPGLDVADVGAGPGYFTLPAADLVGPGGRVYGLDVEPKRLAVLAERAGSAGLTNVETLVSEPARLPLPDAAVDLVLLINVLHEIPDRSALLAEGARILRPDGTIAVIEFLPEDSSVGPKPAVRIPPETIVADLRKIGFRDVARFDAGESQYGLLGRAKRS